MLIDIDNKPRKLKKDDSVVIWGCTRENTEMIRFLDIPESSVFVADADEELHGKTKYGCRVDAKEIIAKYPDATVVSVLDKKSVKADIETYGNKVLFYTPDDNRNYLKLHATNLQTISGRTNYKYIHFIIDDKFVEPLYELVSKYLVPEEHLFVVEIFHNKEEYGAYEITQGKANVLYVDSRNMCRLTNELNLVLLGDFFKQCLRYSHKIILHSGWQGRFIKEIVDQFGDKTEWLAWGGDMSFPLDSFFPSQVIPRLKCGWVGPVLLDEVSKRYSIKMYDAEGARYSYIEESIVAKKDNFKGITILLGHSGDPIGDHSRGFELLKKYKDCDIRIYAPLTYGDEEYIKKVIKEGKEVFGDRFLPITEHMARNEYASFLCLVDVALFTFKELKGLTTGAYLSKIGTPIFMRGDLIDLASARDIKASSLSEIESKSYDELMSACRSRKVDFTGIKQHNEQLAMNWQRLLDKQV